LTLRLAQPRHGALALLLIASVLAVLLVAASPADAARATRSDRDADGMKDTW
jgi:hypothetical protein